ncbi:MAG: AAA family ATPase [Pseudomonadota bacterium]|nr:AAA family ATPase [Pseudomonadota bacterium]
MPTLRSHTTILFADLSSSTRIGESLDPEVFAELLGRVRKLAEEVITRHGGVINQFYGDGVLAAFGFLEPREDDVLRAITSALELHEEVARLPPVPGLDIPNSKVQLHSGIHSDLVFVQEGDSIQGRYKLTGDALNTAARLSDAAKAGEILVSAATICNLLPYFNTVLVPPLKLKGKRNELDAYKVLSRTPVRTRFEASRQRGLRQLIGREEELKQMFGEFARLQQDGCQYFELCGDPGIGKTRLCEEFLAQTPHNTVVLKAYCESGDSGRPLQPFIQVINTLFGLKSNTIKLDSRTRFKDILRLNYRALSRFEDDYLALLELAEGDPKAVDSTLLAQRSIAAITALIRHLAKHKTVVLYLDDWHLADDLTSKALLNLMRELDRFPVFIVTATRVPAYQFRSFRGTTLYLNSLDLEQSTLLASGLFNPSLLKQFANTLYEQSGGNPLFIEELCQSMSAAPLSRIYEGQLDSVPVTLSGLIGARLKRLPGELHQLVNIAAVLGNKFDQWLLEAVAGPQVTSERLAELASLDVIYQGGTEGTLRFKHGITRDVAYDKIGFYEKRATHAKTAKVLEANLHQRGSDNYLELLAYHHQGAEDRFNAGFYAELAGDRAMATMSLDRAGSQYKRALAMLDPDTCAESSYGRWKSILLKFGWVSVFDPLLDHRESFQRGLALTRVHDDFETMAKIHYWLAYLYYALGDADHSIEHCEQALALAQQMSAWPLQVETTALLGQAKGSASDYDQALVLLDNAMQAKQLHYKRKHLSVGSAYALACKGTILGDQGLFDPAYRCFETALESLRGEDYFHVEGSVLGLYSAVNLWQGRWEEGRDIAIRAHHAAQRISRSYMSSIYLSLAAYAEWKMEGNESAISVVLSHTSNLEQHHKFLYLSLNYGWLSEMLVSVGKWQAARKYAARALVRARHNDRLGEAMAYRALAQISEHQHPGSFRKYLDRAISSAHIRQARHETAKNNLLWGSILLRHKQQTQAHHHLDLALRDFKAMKMPWFSQQVIDLLQKSSASA